MFYFCQWEVRTSQSDSFLTSFFDHHFSHFNRWYTIKFFFNWILVDLLIFEISWTCTLKQNLNWVLNYTNVFKNILYKRGHPGAARDYVTISLWNSPVQIDLRTQRALGWGEPPTNKIFIHKPTPRINFCLLAPTQFSKHTPPFGRVDPAGPRFGWAPRK